jgi:tetratricopeptide (TPR) repeat protein/predicted Ser/Thr protein kinase
MEAERFRAVRELFEAVCDLPPDARESRLAGVDPELLEKVLELLAVDTASSRPLEPALPIRSLLGAIAGEEVLQAGMRIGAWTLSRQIGAGGMGTVYLAQRSDGHFEQTAAIKVLRGIPSPAALDRLARERQILARLSHPHIARLLDGGATPKGQPFLVMEYIDGEPIDRFCAREKLSVAGVLGLLVTVCDAVTHAHAQLIIHCDLKPSNLLVSASGHVWLVDFGIARLLDLDDSRAPQSPVSQGAHGFTPRFSSPEQEAGEHVTTASDVFSLGRLMQELLASTPAGSDRELAAIVDRATRTDPAQRYGSAAELKRDIARFLAIEPVQAMPQSFAYRTHKLLRRRWQAAVAAAVFVAVIGVFTVQLAADRDRALIAEQQAIAERDRATQAAEVARQISLFLVSVFDGANPDAGGGEIPTARLVDQALLRIDDELAGQAGVQTELIATLAGVQATLGNPDAALQSYQRALDIERGLQRPLVLADLLGRLALLQRRSFSKSDALLSGRESLALYRSQPEAPPAELAAAVQLLGSIAWEAGQIEEGQQLLSEALGRWRAIDPDSAAVATALEAVAAERIAASDYTQAETLLRDSLTLHEGLDPDGGSALNAREMLGATLGHQRRFSEAESVLREALSERRALNGEEDVNVPWRLSELARVIDNDGRPQQALPIYAEALELAGRKMGTDSVPYAVMLNNIALVQQRIGDFAAADVSFRRALEIVTEPWGEDSLGLASLRHNYATLLLLTDPAAAGALLRANEAVQAAAHPASHASVVATHLALAEQARLLGDRTQARVWLSTVDEVDPIEPLQAADRERLRALLGAPQGDIKARLAGLERAEQMRQDVLGERDARTWLARIERAELLAAQTGSAERADGRALAADVLAKVDAVLVPDSPWRHRIAALLK